MLMIKCLLFILVRFYVVVDTYGSITNKLEPKASR